MLVKWHHPPFLSIKVTGPVGTFEPRCEKPSFLCMLLHMRKQRRRSAVKTKTQISFAVTAKLISTFVFATWIEQSLYFLNPKFQASSYLVWLYSRVCVGPGRKPRRPVFSERGSFGSMSRFACMIPTHSFISSGFPFTLY